MEGKLWYKKSQYNTQEEIQSLRAHRLRVPLIADPDRTLPFDQICPLYFKSSGESNAMAPRPSSGKSEETYQRRERKTERGRSIQYRKNRDF